MLSKAHVQVAYIIIMILTHARSIHNDVESCHEKTHQMYIMWFAENANNVQNSESKSGLGTSLSVSNI